MTNFETNQPVLLKLCWLIAQQWKAELAYSRAQWRVAYYRKLKAKLEKSKKTSERWSDHLELTKKIESERLNALRKQENVLDTKKRTRKPITAAKNKLGGAAFSTNDGKIVGISVPIKTPHGAKWQFYDADEITDMADQYEAETVLNKALAKEDGK
jgi:hypothetical protein